MRLSVLHDIVTMLASTVREVALSCILALCDDAKHPACTRGPHADPNRGLVAGCSLSTADHAHDLVPDIHPSQGLSPVAPVGRAGSR